MNGSSSVVDDHDAGVGDGVAPAILLGVVADERAARDQDVAVDDRARMRAWRPTRTPGIRMRVLDVAEAVHAHVRAEDAADAPCSPRRCSPAR